MKTPEYKVECNISDVKDGDTLTVGQPCTITFIKNKNNYEKNNITKNRQRR